MSNFLAIATATEVLRQTLQTAADAAVPGALVSTVRPSASGAGLTQKGINLYLYQTSANAHWRNADLPTRSSDGHLRQRPQAALDLHYLLSFYGDDGLLETQRLLGVAVRALHAWPVLTRQTIRNVIDALLADDPGHYLKDSDLAEQVELVKLTPLGLGLEELSKLWSVFFQTPYALSVAYVGTVILIESDDMPQTALPVGTRKLTVVPFRQPVVTSLSPQTVHAGDVLTLRGHDLAAPQTRVVFNDIAVTPDPSQVRDTEIQVLLPAGLRAGVNTVRVVHELDFGTPGDPHRGAESNVAAFVLRPTINGVAAAGGGGSVDVTVDVDPVVGVRQEASLLLNERSVTAGAAYRLRFPARGADTSTLVATLGGAKPAEYFVRVQIDGAESLLDLDPGSPQFGPRVTLP